MFRGNLGARPAVLLAQHLGRVDISYSQLPDASIPSLHSCRLVCVTMDTAWSQAKQLCELILGCGTLPEPELEWAAFKSAVLAALASVPSTVDPRTGRRSAWINVARFGAVLGRNALCEMLNACAVL